MVLPPDPPKGGAVSVTTVGGCSVLGGETLDGATVVVVVVAASS
ncbi:MAG: hypothetical protein U0U69_02245 [Acidimicrobiia bacterium]